MFRTVELDVHRSQEVLEIGTLSQKKGIQNTLVDFKVSKESDSNGVSVRLGMRSLSSHHSAGFE